MDKITFVNASLRITICFPTDTLKKKTVLVKTHCLFDVVDVTMCSAFHVSDRVIFLLLFA